MLASIFLCVTLMCEEIRTRTHPILSPRRLVSVLALAFIVVDVL